MRDKGWARLLRIVGIVVISLMALFGLMGSADTSCIALNLTGDGDEFAGIGPFQ